ncbi:putative protease inhibitor [Hypoxylon cercidicola]|nr:putative protease inhibitor [Hypoxylon cercidicola]
MPVSSSVKTALSLIETDKSKVLGLTIGKHADVQPGQFIPKADARAAPELSFASLSPDKPYIILCVDLDAPFPSFPVLGPVLHWLQPGAKATPIEVGGGGGGFSLKAAADEPFVANYAGPGPPPISSPHRYVFLVYEQPEGFDGKKLAPPDGKEMGIGPRVRFDVDKWVKESKVGLAVAVTYFNSK